MEYIATPVPSEVELLKKMRADEIERIEVAFAAIVPGVTTNRDARMTVFRRRGTGVSQRGRTPGHENVVIQGGDIVAAPSQGMFAYVLRDGETEPPPDIQKVWAMYRRVDEVLAANIKVGLTPREIVANYTAIKFENYFGPRIGSNGPQWMWDIPLPANHHFVLEYFIYMPWPSDELEDQYLFWWNHEQALATADGVQYLSPPQEELFLIR